jgi:hypothetical protein
MTRVANLLRLPIAFQAADGSTVHAPLIAASVAGVDTLLVLDTGSDVHLLTTETAERAGLPLEEGEEGTDHSGTTLPSWSAGDVTMHAEGAADEVAAWLGDRSPELTTVSLERDGKTPTPRVGAAVKPFPETAAMLNTGGRNTEFDESVVPGLAASDTERLGGGVCDTDVVGPIAGGDQVLVVGGTEIPVASLAVHKEMGYPPGLIGMNVLRGTVLALDADPAGMVTWQLSGAS